MKNKKHGPGILYSDFQVYDNDKNKIIGMIRNLITGYSKYSSFDFDQILVPIGFRESFKELLESQEEIVSKMELEKQARYKEKQEWAHGILLYSTKIHLLSQI